MHASVHKKSYVVQCTRWVLSVHGGLLWANRHHPRKKRSVTTLLKASMTFHVFLNTESDWGIVENNDDDDREAKDEKQGTKDPKSQQHSTRKRWRQQQQHNLHPLPFLCIIISALRHCTNLLHTNRFFVLLHYFFSVQLRRVESNLFSFHIASCILCTFMQVQRSIPSL